jgi:hypothetical protein
MFGISVAVEMPFVSKFQKTIVASLYNNHNKAMYDTFKLVHL